MFIDADSHTRLIVPCRPLSAARWHRKLHGRHRGLVMYKTLLFSGGFAYPPGNADYSSRTLQKMLHALNCVKILMNNPQG